MGSKYKKIMERRLNYLDNFTIKHKHNFNIKCVLEITNKNIHATGNYYNTKEYYEVLKAIFMFIIPSLLLGVIPVETVKIIKLRLIILTTFFWIIISIIFFYKSIKKYESNNFFGFGN